MRENVGLQQSSLGAKLDLRSAYNLVQPNTFSMYILYFVTCSRTNCVKMVEWPELSMVKELQCFLGFANFYHRFINNFSAVAAPLTSLLKGKPKRIKFTPEARLAFDTLKQRFVLAPALKIPDLGKPFVVKVDASEVGLGGVLSQYHGTPAYYIHAPSFQRSCLRLKGIMILPIACAWRSKWRWKSGVTGRKGLGIPSRFSRTTKT